MTKHSITPDTIYFMRRADGTGPIKIGTSGMLETRRKQLCSTMKAKIVILATAPGSYSEETCLHRSFADCRETGEWFSPTADLLALISKVAATGALPRFPGDDMVSDMGRRYVGGETLQSIGDSYGMTRERVRQILRKSGVASQGARPKQAAPVTTDELEMARLYGEGTSPAELRKAFPHLRLALVLRRTGTPAKPAGYFLRREDRDEIIAKVADLYALGLTTAEIARRCGLAHQTAVYPWLRLAGVKVCRRGNPDLPFDEIVDVYQKGEGINAIARRYGSSAVTIRRRLVERGVLRTREQSESIRIRRSQEAKARLARQAA